MVHKLIETITTPELRAGFVHAWAYDGLGASIAVPRVRICQRLALPDAPCVKSGEIVLWSGYASGTESALLSAAQGILAPEELAHARDLRNPDDRRIFLVAHLALRRLLAAALRYDAAALAFERGPDGKPALREDMPRELDFNISHTHGRALVGLSAAAIGVDVERIDPFPELLETAREVFAPEVAAVLAESSDTERVGLFFRHWSLGEAFIKATGQGIGQGLDSFAFSHRGAPILTRVTPGYGPAKRWHFGLLDEVGL